MPSVFLVGRVIARDGRLELTDTHHTSTVTLATHGRLGLIKTSDLVCVVLHLNEPAQWAAS